MQEVRFNPETETIDGILQRADIHKTTLTAFFDACRTEPALTKNLLYSDFPSKFTWNLKLEKNSTTKKNWSQAVGVFDLRLLL